MKRLLMGATAGAATLFLLGILAVAGWVQHLYTCFTTDAWGFLVAGAIFVPVGVIHGWGVWLGLW